MAKIIIKDGQIVSQDGTQLKFENTPISGTTAEFTSITAQNLYGNGSNLDNVVKTTNVSQTIDGTKTFLNSIKLYSSIYNLGGTGTSPQYNVSIGSQAGNSMLAGTNNIALGTEALFENETGVYNIAIGNSSLRNSFSSYNTGIGSGALRDVSGNQNIGIGSFALYQIVGDTNIAIGSSAGANMLSGQNNVFIGPYAAQNDSSLSDTTIISNGWGKERLRIDSNGNVSINSTSATDGGITYRLFVNGSFKATTIYSPYANLDEVFVGSGGIEVDGDINANSNIYGDGSGLTNVNAALLNSQPGSYYLNYNNFTNLPTIGNATITLSAGDGLQTGGDFTTNQTTNETITLAVNDTVVRTTGDQTIDGIKTFINDIEVNSLTVGKGNSSLTYNTALGVDVLSSAIVSAGGGDTSPGSPYIDGDYNTGIGYEALKGSTNGDSNVAIGYQSLTFGEKLYQNVAIGYRTGANLAFGGSNTFVGYLAGYTTSYLQGYNNLFLGTYAGYNTSNISHTTIISNGIDKERLRIDSSGNVSINDTSAYGYKLYVNGSFKATTIYSTYANLDEVFVGTNGLEVDGDINANGAIYGDGSNLSNVVKTTNVNQSVDGTKTFLNDIVVNSLTVGKGAAGFSGNTVLGEEALESGTTFSSGDGGWTTSNADYNVAVGYRALKDSTKNRFTTAVGTFAGSSFNHGSYNTFLGASAGHGLSIGYSNTFLGFTAGSNITTGSANVIVGTTGIAGEANYNVIIGSGAGPNGTGGGNNNIFLGHYAGTNISSNINDTVILAVDSDKERLRIDSSGNVSINDTSAYGYKLYVNGSFKANIINSPYASLDEVYVGSNGLEIDGDINANGAIYGDGSNLSNVVKTTNVDQTIDGTKTFLNTIKMGSSSFYNVGLKGTTGDYSNSVLGYLALQNTTTGMNNVAIGSYSLRYNVIGNDNIAIGSNALQDSTHYKNIGIGKNALTDLATGDANVALGYYAGAGVTGGSNNVFIGRWAAYNEGTISDTIIFATGLSSERMRIDSTGNIGIGTTITSGYKLTVNGSSKFNSDMLLLGQIDVSDQIITDTGFVGDGSLITNINSNNISNNGRFVTIAGEETITGDKTFSSDVTFNSNIRVNSSITVGSGLYSSDNNTAVGANTLAISGHNTSIANSGEHNTAIGKNALMYNTTGYFNTGIGSNALNLVSTGYGNVALGYAAGNEITTGTNNIFIGTGAGYGLETSTDSIVIGGYDFSSQTGAALNKSVIISDGQNLRYTYGPLIDNQPRHVFWGKGDSSDTSYTLGTGPFVNLHSFASSYPSLGNMNILGTIEIGATVLSEAKAGAKIIVAPQSTWASGNQKATDMLFYMQDGSTTDTTNIQGSSPPALKVHGGNRVSINSLSADSTLHVSNGNSGVTPFSSAGITVESNTSSYINMIAPSSGLAQITFGDNSNSDFGYLRANFSDEEMSFGLRGTQSKLFINPYCVAVAGTNPGEDTTQRFKVDGPASVERVLTIDSTDVGAQNAYIFFKNVANTSSTSNLSMGFDKNTSKFHIYKGAFGSTTPLMTITSDYKIGFGDSTPTYQLEVNNTYSASDSVLNIQKSTANAYTRFQIGSSNPKSYEVGAFWDNGYERFKIRNSQYDVLNFTGTKAELMEFATIDTNSLHLGGDPGFASPALWIQAPGSNTYTYAEDSHSDIIIKGDDSHMQLISYGSGYGSAYFLSTAQAHWAIYQHAAEGGQLKFGYTGTLTNGSYNLITSISEKGYITSSTDVNQIDFTGQHRSHVSEGNLADYDDKTGLIVASSGEYANFNNAPITINEALPKVKLTNTRNQKSVFGVISDSEDENNEQREYAVGNFVSTYEKPTDDNRLIINSLGEGGIWVVNVNGNLENGDYITTCEVPGYGMKQDSEFLANYTVAKITCDCDFDLNSPIYMCEEFQWEGQTLRRAFVGCTYHCG